MATHIEQKGTAFRIQRIREAVSEARNQGQLRQAQDDLMEIPFSELEWIRDD
jgi:hypothetical protein